MVVVRVVVEEVEVSRLVLWTWTSSVRRTGRPHWYAVAWTASTAGVIGSSMVPVTRVRGWVMAAPKASVPVRALPGPGVVVVVRVVVEEVEVSRLVLWTWTSSVRRTGRPHWYAVAWTASTAGVIGSSMG